MTLPALDGITEKLQALLTYDASSPLIFSSGLFLFLFAGFMLVYSMFRRAPIARIVYVILFSLYFYYKSSGIYFLLLIFAATSDYWIAKGIHAARSTRAKRWLVVLSVAVNLGMLAYFKYTNFLIDIANQMFGQGFMQFQNIFLPVGISFYIFQALSYVVDVYRGDVRMETNFIKYAAFVSFFPQLVAGPIERSTNLLTQFDTPHKLEYDNVRDGLLRMVWGFFLKIVIADRAAILVNQVFNYCNYYEGPTVLIAAVLFAFQVYGDFAGYSNIAIGAAQVMGFKLMKNFERPYLAVSVSNFWRRWHISLSTWFRDYLYIPLGGNRKGTVRKYINQMIVMLVSGLWHGAAWNYVIWGGINGLYQVAGGITKPFRRRIQQKTGARTKTLSWRIGQVLTTFVLIDLSWIFFRANSLGDAMHLLSSLFRGWNTNIFFDGSLLKLGLDQTEWLVLLGALLILLAVSLMQEKGVSVLEAVKRQQLWFRWLIYLAAIFVVLLTGIYGPGFAASSFIYFQF